MAKEPEPITRQMLRRESARLLQELEKLRREVEALSGTPALQRPRSERASSVEATATEADLAHALNPVKQSLADLALAIHRLTRKPPSDPPQEEHRQRLSDSGEVYRIRLPGSVRNRTVTISNQGRTTVLHPRLVVNGRRDWFSTASILEEILRPEMSDREKALAIWALLTANRRHDEPGHEGIEWHDPVRFLNVYGYGFCDDSATNLMVLAEQAGLPARVWGLSGHVVPEVYFDGSWHLLDPDCEVYYLEDDGETIAGVETLQVRPDILRARAIADYMPLEKLVDIYITTENNRLAPGYKQSCEARHTMGYVLRPGELLMRSWENWGQYFSSLYLDEPEVYGNGRFTYAPVLEDGLAVQDAEEAEGIGTRAVAGAWVLMASETQRSGNLVYRFASPYPFLDGQVAIEGAASGAGHIELAFSEAGKEWRPVWEGGESGPIRVEIPLGGYFRKGYGTPIYTYFLKLSLSGNTQVHSLRFSSDVQVAPLSLPALEEGDNEVRYVDESGTPRDVEIVFGYDCE